MSNGNSIVDIQGAWEAGLDARRDGASDGEHIDLRAEWEDAQETSGGFQSPPGHGSPADLPGVEEDESAEAAAQAEVEGRWEDSFRLKFGAQSARPTETDDSDDQKDDQ